jgi:hypothetical protein
MSRGFLAAVTAACVAFAPCALVLVDAAKAATTVNSSKSNGSEKATTVRGSKSNGSDKATTVRGSKSNSSEKARMGGGGGGHGQSGRALNLNTSRSNKP